MVDIPVLRVDQPMADKAVSLGPRIGVAATLPTTLVPTANLIERRAAAAGRQIKICSRLCAGAFEALMGGDSARHDAMVAAALRELTAEVDVIVLAQASMARVADGLDESARRVPILASPAIAIEHVATVL
jgi:Asp/Glu/hydantoin racemase